MIRYIILPKKTKTAGSSSLTRYLFIPQRTTYVTYRYNPVLPVFTPCYVIILFLLQNKIVTFWHNTCLEGHGHNSGPARTPPSARQSQRAECLIGLRRKPFGFWGEPHGQAFKTEYLDRSGISLFLMLFFIYFYCHIDQWVIEPCPRPSAPPFSRPSSLSSSSS